MPAEMKDVLAEAYRRFPDAVNDGVIEANLGNERYAFAEGARWALSHLRAPAAEIRDADAVCTTCRWKGNHAPDCPRKDEPWPTIPVDPLPDFVIRGSRATADGETRERVARIVDPRAWMLPATFTPRELEQRPARQAEALAKADAVLALFPRVGEDLRWKLRNFLFEAGGSPDHLTSCERTMGATHPCTCGADDFRAMLSSAPTLPQGQEDAEWAIIESDGATLTLAHLDGREITVDTSCPQGQDGWRPTHRHVKRGNEYRVLFEATLQFSGPWDDTAMVVYEDRNGLRWVRTEAEFNDGRFEALPTLNPQGPSNG